MKLILDTNVLISGIFWKGPPFEVLRVIESGEDIFLIQSPDTFNEFEEVIKRGKFAGIARKRKINISAILESLFTISSFYQISESSRKEAKKKIEIRDPDDLKFLELAIETGADFIVSGDPHLLEIKTYNQTRILKPSEFLNYISR